MYAQDYLSGALDGADNDAKPQRAACLRAHASVMRASIRAAMLVCTAALLALRPGTHSLSVVAVGMLTGFAYNASWLPAATVHNADVPDITADRAAGVKTIAAAVGRSNSLLVSAALAAAGTLAGLATGAVWLAGVGPFALLATSVIAAGWDEAGVMLDDSQGMLAGMLAALLV
ncbi:hypothetical protein OEZ86_008380 [Tetradesmus obliquus]|nr:hypothetical protein OEZ86_008380 [Tetradesmus obliquus]